MIRKWTTFLFFWPKNLDYCQTVKHQHPSFFLVYIGSISIQIRALVDSPYLQARVTKKRCHEIIQNQTRSAELIRYKPSIFPCCSNSALFSLLCDTILHLVISSDPFFLLSSVCLKTNEEIFKHWTTLCTEKSYSLTYNDSLYPDRCYHFVLQCYECWCYTSEWASVIWSSCLPVLHAKSWDQVF